jgi:hypothetical protein
VEGLVSGSRWQLLLFILILIGDSGIRMFFSKARARIGKEKQKEAELHRPTDHRQQPPPSSDFSRRKYRIVAKISIARFV